MTKTITHPAAFHNQIMSRTLTPSLWHTFADTRDVYTHTQNRGAIPVLMKSLEFN